MFSLKENFYSHSFGLINASALVSPVILLETRACEYTRFYFFKNFSLALFFIEHIFDILPCRKMLRTFFRALLCAKICVRMREKFLPYAQKFPSVCNFIYIHMKNYLHTYENFATSVYKSQHSFFVIFMPTALFSVSNENIILNQPYTLSEKCIWHNFYMQ